MPERTKAHRLQQETARLREQPEGGAAGVHGAQCIRTTGSDAAEREREGGQEGAAGAGCRCAGKHVYEAPQGPVEEVLAGIWQELLGLERVGRNDSFFDLGGTRC